METLSVHWWNFFNQIQFSVLTHTYTLLYMLFNEILWDVPGARLHLITSCQASSPGCLTPFCSIRRGGDAVLLLLQGERHVPASAFILNYTHFTVRQQEQHLTSLCQTENTTGSKLNHLDVPQLQILQTQEDVRGWESLSDVVIDKIKIRHALQDVQPRSEFCACTTFQPPLTSSCSDGQAGCSGKGSETGDDRGCLLGWQHLQYFIHTHDVAIFTFI